jgi:hypothetical protein
MKSFFYTFSFCFLLIAANAQIFQDNFSAYTLSNDLNGQGGWTNNSSNPGGLGTCVGIGCNNTKVTAPSLTYTGYATSPKTIGLGPGQDGIGRSLFPAVNSGSVYVSMLINLSSIGCSATCNADADFFRVLNGSAGNNFETATRLVVQQATGGFKVGIGKGAQSNGIIYTSGVYTFTTTHLIVIKYTINTGSGNDDVVNLYVDPNFTGGEPVVADVSIGTGLADINANMSIDRMAFRLNALSGDRMPIGNAGAISVATTWAALAHGAASVNNIDRDFSNAKVFAISSTQAVFQMNSTRADNIIIEMTDVTGRVVLRQQARLNAGANSFVLQTGILLKGIYNVRALSSKGVTTPVRFMQ